MSKRETQRKGDIALSKAIYDFTELGYDVSLPVTESATYDIVVDDGNGLYKVQCKFCGENVPNVDMRRIHSNSKGYVVKQYATNDYDWLYVYKQNIDSYLVKSFITTQIYTPKESDLLKK